MFLQDPQMSDQQRWKIHRTKYSKGSYIRYDSKVGCKIKMQEETQSFCEASLQGDEVVKYCTGLPSFCDSEFNVLAPPMYNKLHRCIGQVKSL